MQNKAILLQTGGGYAPLAVGKHDVENLKIGMINTIDAHQKRPIIDKILPL